eukprot:2625943-Amphidinium_carterae.1
MGSPREAVKQQWDALPHLYSTQNSEVNNLCLLDFLGSRDSLHHELVLELAEHLPHVRRTHQ